MCRSCQVERFRRRVDAEIVGHGFDPEKVEIAMKKPDEKPEAICWLCGRVLETGYHGDPPICRDCNAQAGRILEDEQ